MSSAQTASASSPSITVPRADYDALQAQVQSLKTQLDWFKRQLFGSKSEKRQLLEPAIQADLLAKLGEAPSETPTPATEQITYTRRTSKQQGETCVTEQGLRFDETVPVEVIELPAPELSGSEADQYIVIDEKITRRLAQRPGSYVVLEYHRPVLKHLPSQTLTTVAAPSAVFEGALADVSLLAGLLVDKFAYHLPLYRQHQRLRDAGITLSRATLTHPEFKKPIMGVHGLKEGGFWSMTPDERTKPHWRRGTHCRHSKKFIPTMHRAIRHGGDS